MESRDSGNHASTQLSTSSFGPPQRLGERYELTRILGRGGMATVYEAVERSNGRRVALKRLSLHSDETKQRRNAELFEREFHALSQLAHPRIVEVYDFGIDDALPFYTMELLDGGDLQQLAPLPWPAACAIARDIASALSLMHSRRLVHRDVSPRNVHRTQQGFAKLLDFGALAPMGPCKLVVGTPPCCAPESVGLQTLDGRTDLFALGATLYYMLVGRHAYAARQFALLNDAWLGGFLRPGTLVEAIPRALDELVTDLLRLEPDARPSNASEVLERLAAIDGQPHSEQLGVAQAYLSRPSLVGRELQLRRVRRGLKRSAEEGQRVFAIEGSSGVGRSRFLDACMLEATLLGASAVRADADDALRGEYGVVHALGRQLLTIRPASALHNAEPSLALLSQIIPELRESEPAQAQPPRAARPELQAAMQAWLQALARDKPLVLAVDDFHRIDEPSAALLALLAQDAPPGLHLFISFESGADGSSEHALKLLLEASTRLTLQALSSDESEMLLNSLFGDVPNIRTFAQRLHDLSGGNPRDLLGLAQHLVDRRIVHYEAGAWTVAAQVDAADLPSSMAQALRARVDALGACARELATAFALCPDRAFELDECQRLRDGCEPSALRDDLDELLRAEVVRRIESSFMLSHGLWTAPLCASLEPGAQRALQARLARVLLARGEEFRAGQHWLRAGEYARALDVLVAHADASQDLTAQSSETFVAYARSLPSDWFQTYEQALQLCDSLGRPPRDAFVLRGRLTGIVPAFGTPDNGQVAVLLAQLARASGLRDFEELDDSLAPEQRVELALQRAQARYEAAAPDERLIEPRLALTRLARAISSSASQVVIRLDVPHLHSMPVLTPFAGLTPALGAMSKLVEGMDARYTGRFERARAIYRTLLDEFERPELGGLEGSYAEMTRLAVMNALGASEACMGLASSLLWAQQTESHAAYRVNAVQTRMLYHLYQGDIRSADACRQLAERLRLQTLQLYGSSHLQWEIGAHIIAEDLTHLRHAIEQLAELAARYESWQAVKLYATAEYDRMRGDPSQALQKIEAALQLAAPGMHPLWAQMAATHARSLLECGHGAQALELAQAYVDTAQRCELGYVADPLRLTLGLCQASAGQHDGEQTADAVIERLHSQAVEGLHLGLAYEMRARIARVRRDDETYARFAERCGEIYCRHRHPALLAKHKRLRYESEPARPGPVDDASPDAYETYTATRVAAALENCQDPEQRAHLALTILLRRSGSNAGALYALRSDGLEPLAAIGGMLACATLEARAREYLHAHVSCSSGSTATARIDATMRGAALIEDGSGQLFRPVVLSHPLPDGTLAVMGVALLAMSAQVLEPLSEIASTISRFWAEHGLSAVLVFSE